MAAPIAPVRAGVGCSMPRTRPAPAANNNDNKTTYMVKVADVIGVNPQTDQVIRIPIFCDVPEAAPRK